MKFIKQKILVVAAIALLSLSSVSVFAANSPTAATQYKVQIHDQTVGAGSATVTVPGGKVETSTGSVEVGKEVTLKVTPDSGKVFSKWDIAGTYTIVSGSETSDTIVILPTSDVVVKTVFTDAAQPTTVATETTAAQTTTAASDVNDDEYIDDGDNEEDEDVDVEDEDEDKGESDSSTTSPKTGAPVAAVAITLLTVGGAAILSKKKF